MTVQMIPRIQGQKGPMTAKRYYRVGEVAVHFSISSQTVYRMIDMGDLKAVRLRGWLRVSVEELRLYEKRRRTDL